MNLETLSPVEIDTIYVERLRRLDDASHAARSAAHAVLSQSGNYVFVRFGRRSVEYHVRRDSGLLSGRQYSLEQVQPHVLDVQTCVAESLAPQAVIDAYCDANVALSEARVEVEEIDAIYRASPWSRYWLVTSSDGHVHRSCHCHTCNKGRQATGFALVPSLSGQSDSEAVAALGPALCSACFPEAPVESREQATIPARLALTLWEKGFEAFQQAREKAKEDAQKRAAERCPGSGEQGKRDRYEYVRCPVCGWGCRSTTGRVRPHKGKAVKA